MTLVNLNNMLKHAMDHGYAVGSFNMVDVNSLEAILRGAVQLRSPVIVSVAEIHFPYVDIEKLAFLMRTLTQDAPVPVALHLDHGQSLSAIMRAMQSGFTSVMFDGSQLPLQENILRTAEIVRFAHAAGVSVEAELGHVGGAEGQLENDEDDSLFTDPLEAGLFVRQTGVDALAVAIGSAHGVYKKQPQLDFARLERIKEQTNIPLVLHGGSGIPDEDIRQSIRRGICKINVYTELSQGANQAVHQALAAKPQLPYPEIKISAGRAIEKIVMEKIKNFGGGQGNLQDQ
ncbi:class II fructose-bisphosphate aldolase [Desulforamulus ruminis]|uniref:Ketose-bisphosphate aldolase n=1 Tax=Desulforamulus ruminis (strain ATCC 23193 / DSM 2154 / NCIMB 8452 / DL) TaxID=696281 RepID=F6DUV6_DESRL|nr:class II fructose-bisphosphate aldolase [Desulforamulus ruminis]AEG61353.1 ketose-bisphosphate aldolase [Desulforamulus ruminis DSM 2154]